MAPSISIPWADGQGSRHTSVELLIGRGTRVRVWECRNSKQTFLHKIYPEASSRLSLSTYGTVYSKLGLFPCLPLHFLGAVQVYSQCAEAGGQVGWMHQRDQNIFLQNPRVTTTCHSMNRSGSLVLVHMSLLLITRTTDSNWAAEPSESYCATTSRIGRTGTVCTSTQIEGASVVVAPSASR